MSTTILIVDDDASIITSLALLLKQAGYQSRTATSPAQALDELKSNSIELVLQDMNFSRQTTGEEGLSLLQQIKSLQPNLPVILMTAWGSISLAVKGVKAGAHDFITKPWTNEQLLQSIRTTLSLVAASTNGRPTSPSREELDKQYDFQSIVGRNPKLLNILQTISRVSTTDASVLITGESGTGKELIAEAIHKNSYRKDKPFVKVNLGGISQTLFESEMFGHVKGAFTDARQDRKGRFEIAHGGTIFLDEIGDLDAACQVKLLRVLQDRTYEVLGSSETRTVDVRVISATNANLPEMIEAGEFREDLLYRLNLIALHVPPLRERRDDIPPLANHFLLNIANIYRRNNFTISESAMKWLQHLPWHGNIRQLKQAIERAVLMTPKDILEIDDFSMPLTMDSNDLVKNSLPTAGSMTLEEIERAMITQCMQQFGGNISKVAEALGLSRAALYRRLEKFGISP
ncbi:MAG: sigma-54-dependent Fis family transcriptional regulator [Ignavibacteria bacterium]|nr:sigma-54-dependent Fis family transcriptional regulator [Ignavibacteria bacterium]MBI3766160.1 sigma-54-dependent Fis family transcriptional regulator [Ignavibacteriales bacterium]